MNDPSLRRTMGMYIFILIFGSKTPKYTVFNKNTVFNNSGLRLAKNKNVLRIFLDFWQTVYTKNIIFSHYVTLFAFEKVSIR